MWTKQLALKGSDTLGTLFGVSERAALHSNGCQAQGKLHSHVSWQQVVPLWERRQRWGDATGRAAHRADTKSRCVSPPRGLKEDSSTIWISAHLLHIFYPSTANCPWILSIAVIKRQNTHHTTILVKAFQRIPSTLRCINVQNLTRHSSALS